jgi:hypothetical protein
MRQFSRSELVGSLLVVVVVAAVAIGIALLGPPAEERAHRIDERRVRDLAAIARTVDLYWTRHTRLPSTLEELVKEPGGNVRLNDPNTNDVYEYRPLEAKVYELCARFERDSPQADDGGRLAIARGYPAEGGQFWSHGAGRQCFRREPQKTQ